MNPLVILGAGPAASLLAIALARHDMPAQVIGRRRTAPAVEGLSQRVVEALRQLGCHEALALLGPRWHRVSSWNAQEVEMNGEFVVDRVAFDAALLRDVKAAGVDLRDGLARELARGEGGSFICTPLPLDGRILGVINVRRGRGQPAFTEEEEGMLDCLALFGGKSVQTAQLAFLVKSEFAQRALQGEEVTALAEAFSQGAAQPAQVARMLAKSFYREMKAAGFGNNQIVGAAGEIIDQLSASLRKHGQRMERGRQ